MTFLLQNLSQKLTESFVVIYNQDPHFTQTLQYNLYDRDVSPATHRNLSDPDSRFDHILWFKAITSLNSLTGTNMHFMNREHPQLAFEHFPPNSKYCANGMPSH
jgi:hypothetical protein